MNCNCCNTGKIDRVARIILGSVLIGLAIVTKQLWLYIGIIPLVTGLFGFCPLYKLMKINTCKLGGCSCHTSKEENDMNEEKSSNVEVKE